VALCHAVPTMCDGYSAHRSDTLDQNLHPTAMKEVISTGGAGQLQQDGYE